MKKETKYKVTDTKISEVLDLNLSTISLWKKSKPKLYNHIKQGFLNEMELQDLRRESNQLKRIALILEEEGKDIPLSLQ